MTPEGQKRLPLQFRLSSSGSALVSAFSSIFTKKSWTTLHNCCNNIHNKKIIQLPLIMPVKPHHPPHPSQNDCTMTTMNNSSNNSKKQTFPRKLFALLENAETLGYSNIISWQPCGESFRVWDPERLEQEILPAYFKQSKFKSFLRQINTYHFQRITSGVNRGGYAHPCFLRHRGPESACEDVKRLAPDGDNNSTTCNDSNSNSRSYYSAPSRFFGTKSFFDIRDTAATAALPRLPAPIPLEQARIKSGEITSNDLDSFVNLFDNGPPVVEGRDEQESNKAATSILGVTNVTPKAMEFAADTLLSQPSNKGGLSELEPIPVVTPDPLSTSPSLASSTVTSSSSTPEGAAPMPPPPSLPQAHHAPGVLMPRTTTTSAATVRMIPPPSPLQNSDLHRNENTFPRKVYRMLQDVETNGNHHIVSWINDGTAFQVHDPDAFVQEILPLYFDQSLYESFRRQLNMYSFTRITRGPRKGTCYHKDFIQSDPSRLDKITRRRKTKNKIHTKKKPSSTRTTLSISSIDEC